MGPAKLAPKNRARRRLTRKRFEEIIGTGLLDTAQLGLEHLMLMIGYQKMGTKKMRNGRQINSD